MRRRNAPGKRVYGKTCRGKRRYRDEKSAQLIVREAASSRNRYVPIRAYYCRDCNGWHLSSRPERAA